LRGIGTGIQAGQGLIGAARGRTTRHNRQPTDGEQYLASFDASAAPRRPGGVSCQSYDSSWLERRHWWRIQKWVKWPSLYWLQKAIETGLTPARR